MSNDFDATKLTAAQLRACADEIDRRGALTKRDENDPWITQAQWDVLCDGRLFASDDGLARRNPDVVAVELDRFPDQVCAVAVWAERRRHGTIYSVDVFLAGCPIQLATLAVSGLPKGCEVVLDPWRSGQVDQGIEGHSTGVRFSGCDAWHEALRELRSAVDENRLQHRQASFAPWDELSVVIDAQGRAKPGNWCGVSGGSYAYALVMAIGRAMHMAVAKAA